MKMLIAVAVGVLLAGQSLADVVTVLDLDFSLCLTGESMPTFGACCDDVTGTCTDGVEAGVCPWPNRFGPDLLCSELNPPCGLGLLTWDEVGDADELVSTARIPDTSPGAPLAVINGQLDGVGDVDL